MTPDAVALGKAKFPVLGIDRRGVISTSGHACAKFDITTKKWVKRDAWLRVGVSWGNFATKAAGGRAQVQVRYKHVEWARTRNGPRRTDAGCAHEYVREGLRRRHPHAVRHLGEVTPPDEVRSALANRVERLYGADASGADDPRLTLARPYGVGGTARPDGPVGQACSGEKLARRLGG